MIVRVKNESDRLASGFSDGREDIAGAPREVRIDDENVVLKHDPADVRLRACGQIALPEEHARRQLANPVARPGLRARPMGHQDQKSKCADCRGASHRFVVAQKQA